MKKITSLLLAILLITSVLASCNKETAPQGDTIIPDQPQQLESGETEAPENEAPENEEPKDETPKDEEPKDETPTDEEPKDETPKDEEPKDEAPTDEEPKEEPQIDPNRIVNVAPTDFVAKFSQSNEDLLAKILQTPIKNANIENILPTLPVIASKEYPSGDGGYTYIYENVGKAVYDHCCAAISAAGYARYTANEITGLALPDWYIYNPSMTLISDTAQIDIDLHTGMNRMYINVTPRSASVLPQRSASSYIKPEGNYPTMWVQYGLEDISDAESSLGYIIRIADGSFVIVDGGEYLDGVETRMYEILKKIAPDPNNIVISAWIITHAHGDHVGGFVKFANKYENDKTIRLKQFIFNFPHDSKVVNYWDVDSQDLARQCAKKFGAEMLKVHTGNVLYYADIKINILYTQENYLSANANGIMSNYNGSSIVTQFVMADGTKVLVGADHPVDGIYEGANWCENALVKCYGTALESKVVSTFHHGYGGGANNVIYGVIRPKIVLWSVDNARITASSTPLTAVSHNAYFTTNGKANGVTYYTAGGSSVTILQFANGNPSIKYYKTFAEFKAS